MSRILYTAIHKGDNRLWSPEQMCQYALEAEADWPKQSILILVDKGTDLSSIKYQDYYASLNVAEVIAILEDLKFKLLDAKGI